MARWRTKVQRPPWTDERAVLEACTSCGNCIDACPEKILISGPARTPMLNFASGACTFCAACAEACDEDVFQSHSDNPPWSLVAVLGDTCLLRQNVSCQSCTDVCDTRALRFDLRQRPVGGIDIDVNACTGCGACVNACPVNAITIHDSLMRENVR